VGIEGNQRLAVGLVDIQRGTAVSEAVAFSGLLQKLLTMETFKSEIVVTHLSCSVVIPRSIFHYSHQITYHKWAMKYEASQFLACFISKQMFLRMLSYKQVSYSSALNW